jgi:hypothetical protein
MKAKINCKMVVGKRTYQLYIDCDVDYTDMIVRNNKYVSIYCNNASVDEKNSHRDYKKAFDVSPDGDYHLLVTFKKNPKQLRIYSTFNGYNGPHWFINVQGE